MTQKPLSRLALRVKGPVYSPVHQETRPLWRGGLALTAGLQPSHAGPRCFQSNRTGMCGKGESLIRKKSAAAEERGDLALIFRRLDACLFLENAR